MQKCRKIKYSKAKSPAGNPTYKSNTPEIMGNTDEMGTVFLGFDHLLKKYIRIKMFW